MTSRRTSIKSPRESFQKLSIRANTRKLSLQPFGPFTVSFSFSLIHFSSVQYSFAIIHNGRLILQKRRKSRPSRRAQIPNPHLSTPIHNQQAFNSSSQRRNTWSTGAPAYNLLRHSRQLYVPAPLPFLTPPPVAPPVAPPSEARAWRGTNIRPRRVVKDNWLMMRYSRQLRRLRPRLLLNAPLSILNPPPANRSRPTLSHSLPPHPSSLFFPDPEFHVPKWSRYIHTRADKIKPHASGAAK